MWQPRRSIDAPEKIKRKQCCPLGLGTPTSGGPLPTHVSWPQKCGWFTINHQHVTINGPISPLFLLGKQSGPVWKPFSQPSVRLRIHLPASWPHHCIPPDQQQLGVLGQAPAGHGGRQQPMCDPEGCATLLGAVGGGTPTPPQGRGGGTLPPPWLTQTLGVGGSGGQPPGSPGGGGGRWVPQHTYLKMIPMTH